MVSVFLSLIRFYDCIVRETIIAMSSYAKDVRTLERVSGLAKNRVIAATDIPDLKRQLLKFRKQNQRLRNRLDKVLNGRKQYLKIIVIHWQSDLAKFLD